MKKKWNIALIIIIVFILMGSVFVGSIGKKKHMDTKHLPEIDGVSVTLDSTWDIVVNDQSLPNLKKKELVISDNDGNTLIATFQRYTGPVNDFNTGGDYVRGELKHTEDFTFIGKIADKNIYRKVTYEDSFTRINYAVETSNGNLTYQMNILGYTEKWQEVISIVKINGNNNQDQILEEFDNVLLSLH